MPNMPRSTQWKLAVRNLVRHRRRSALTVGMISMCFGAMLLLSAHSFRMVRHWTVNAAYANYYGHVSIYKKDALERSFYGRSRYLLTQADQAFLTTALANFPEVDFSGRYLVRAGLVSNGCVSTPFLATGVDLAVEARIHEHPELSKWLGTVDRSPIEHHLAQYTDKTPGAIALTPAIATFLGKTRTIDTTERFQPFEAITQCGTEHAEALIGRDANVQLLTQDEHGESAVNDATIAYRFSTGRLFTEDVAIRTSLAFLQKIFATDKVTYMAVFLKNADSVPSFIERFKTHGLQGRAQDFEIYSAMGPELNALDHGAALWSGTMVGFSNVLLSLIVAVIIGNFLAMAARERRGEIGTMRALGYKASAVLSVLHKESVLLLAGSLGVGGGGAFVLASCVNHLGIRYFPPGVPGATYFLLAIDPASVVKVSALLILFSLASSYFVAARTMARQTISQLLARPT